MIRTGVWFQEDEGSEIRLGKEKGIWVWRKELDGVWKFDSSKDPKLVSVGLLL